MVEAASRIIRARQKPEHARSRGALRLRQKIPQRPLRMGVAVCLSRRQLFDRSPQRSCQTASSRRAMDPARRPSGCAPGWAHDPLHPALLPAQLCDAPSRGRTGHPHRAGAARTCQRRNDHDLHARAQQRADGRRQSHGHPLNSPNPSSSSHDRPRHRNLLR